MKANRTTCSQSKITLWNCIQHRFIRYVIHFGEKVENDTLMIKDYILPFTVGCILSNLLFDLVNLLNLPLY